MKSKNDEELPSLTHRELVAITWQQLGVRAGFNARDDDMHAMLAYEASPEDVVDNPINDMRDELIDFIEGHRDRLSLPCNGNCYAHSDGVVLSCFMQYQEDTSGKAH